MKPTKRITDPAFRYVSAAATDIAATFRRIRREQAKEQAAMVALKPVDLPGSRIVVALLPKGKKKG